MKDGRTWPAWRLLLVPPRSGAENMARDSALLDRARATGETVFSIYSWISPTLSFGRNQLAAGRYNRDAIESAGIEVVRRPTGGRTLLHNREVTYSVTGPINETASLRESYERVNRLLLYGLRQLGVDVRESHDNSPAARPSELPCFAEPADGELVTESGKLVGSAQVREDGAMLQHGSILIDDDQQLIPSLLEHASPSLIPPQAATLLDALGYAPSVQDIAAGLFDAVRELEDASADMLDECELKQSTQRYLPHYKNELWTWRR